MRKGGNVLRKVSSVLITLALVAFSSTNTVASAHTSVVKTTPSYKSTLREMPESISIEFTDVLMTLGEKKVNSIEVTDPKGTKVPTTETVVDQRILTVLLPVRSYIDGTYLISYRVVSADGHSISGSYELYLNTPSENAAPIESIKASFISIKPTSFRQGLRSSLSSYGGPIDALTASKGSSDDLSVQYG